MEPYLSIQNPIRKVLQSDKTDGRTVLAESKLQELNIKVANVQTKCSVSKKLEVGLASAGYDKSKDSQDGCLYRRVQDDIHPSKSTHIVKIRNSWKYPAIACDEENKKCVTATIQTNFTCLNSKKYDAGQQHHCVVGHGGKNFRNRGILLIFNNVQFSKASRLVKREGSEKDVVALTEIFTCLGYKVVIKRDSSVNRMLDISRRISELPLLKEHTALFVAILSHGEKNDFLYGSCGNAVQIDDLIEPFRGENCLSLAGKPKIFIVNACRGNTFDNGVNARFYSASCQAPNGNGHAQGYGLSSVKSQSPGLDNMTDGGQLPTYRDIKIPHAADILVAFSSVSGYYSWRNQKEGSWFIQALCEELKDADVETDDFMRILTKASAKVAYGMKSTSAQRNMDQKKQVPCIVSSLTKCLFFE